MMQINSCQPFIANYCREGVSFKCTASLDERIDKLLIELDSPNGTTYSIHIDNTFIQQQGEIFSTCLPSARKIYELMFSNFKDFVITQDGTIVLIIKLVIFHEEIFKTFRIKMHNITHIKQFGKSIKPKRYQQMGKQNQLSHPFIGFPEHAGLLKSNSNMNNYWEKRLSGRQQDSSDIDAVQTNTNISVKDLDFHSQSHHSFNFSLIITQQGAKLTKTTGLLSHWANYVPQLKIEKETKIKIRITKSINRNIFLGLVTQQVFNTIPYKHPEAILYSCNSGDIFEKETCWPTMIKPQINDQIIIWVNLTKKIINLIVRDKKIPIVISDNLVQKQLYLMISMLDTEDEVNIMII